MEIIGTNVSSRDPFGLKQMVRVCMFFFGKSIMSGAGNERGPITAVTSVRPGELILFCESWNRLK
jgi:hypothetical protein